MLYSNKNKTHKSKKVAKSKDQETKSALVTKKEKEPLQKYNRWKSSKQLAVCVFPTRSHDTMLLVGLMTYKERVQAFPVEESSHWLKASHLLMSASGEAAPDGYMTSRTCDRHYLVGCGGHSVTFWQRSSQTLKLSHKRAHIFTVSFRKKKISHLQALQCYSLHRTSQKLLLTYRREK